MLKKYVLLGGMLAAIGSSPVCSNATPVPLIQNQQPPDSNPSTPRQEPNQNQDPALDDNQDTQPAENNPRTQFATKLRDAYWEKNDKKGLKRKAEPKLFECHDQMTKEWVTDLTEEDFSILTNETPSQADEKKVKQLQREYARKSQAVATRLSIARRLAKKIIKAHWDNQAQQGIAPTTFPEYAKEYESTVENWFLDRSLEDLKIFEKSKPSEAERERGEKITAELIKKIDEVKKKYEGNLR